MHQEKDIAIPLNPEAFPKYFTTVSSEIKTEKIPMIIITAGRIIIISMKYSQAVEVTGAVFSGNIIKRMKRKLMIVQVKPVSKYFPLLL